jgi:hypothetical protein
LVEYLRADSLIGSRPSDISMARAVAIASEKPI